MSSFMLGRARAAGASRADVAATSTPSARDCPRCKRRLDAAVRDCPSCGLSLQDTWATAAAGAMASPLPGHASPSPLPGLDAGSESFAPGSVFESRFRVRALLGKGGFGQVYEVESLLFDEPIAFAMKVLHPQLARDDGFRRRFLREARLALSLSHEHIIAVREFGQTGGGLLYYTMDFCAGRPLQDLLANDGPLAPPRAIEIACQILSALRHAHAQGVVHRDLKPANIFVEPAAGSAPERARLGDFGLAKAVQSPDTPPGGAVCGRDQDLTHGGIVGSPRYMAPEQAAGAAIDARADLFALGMILHEMLFGVVPSERQLEDGRFGEPHRGAAGGRRRRALGAIEEVLARALALERERRFASAAEFLAALRRVQRSISSAPRRVAAKLSFALGLGAKAAVAAGIPLALVLAAFHLGSTARSPAEGAAPGPLAAAGATSPAAGGIAAPPAGEATPAPTWSIADEVASYFPLAVGQSFRYRVYSSGPEGGVGELRYTVLSQGRPGHFIVESWPEPRRFSFAIDTEANAVTEEMLLPQEVDAPPRTERRVLIQLPRDPAKRRYEFANHFGTESSRAQVRWESGPITISGETFRDCLLVEEDFPQRRQTTLRLFKKHLGEVAYCVRDSDQREIVYSRILLPDPSPPATK